MSKANEHISMINREISWLSFNHRVLQEAMDMRVPPIERLRFLGIFSNNLDEFFRVRVATLHRMKKIGGEATGYFEMDPEQCLTEINRRVLSMQSEFEKTFGEIVNELKGMQVHFVDERKLSEENEERVKAYFEKVVEPNLVPLMLTKKSPIPRIQDQSIYLAIKMSKHHIDGTDVQYALIEIPDASIVSRFFTLPASDEEDSTDIILIDDIIRLNLPVIFRIFQYDHFEAFTIKLTRDSELDIAEDISISLMEKLSKSVEKRKTGEFVRFVYDQSIPEDLLDFLLKKFQFKNVQGLIPGGRYHNFKDFISFPSLSMGLEFPPFNSIPHLGLEEPVSLLDAIEEKDVLLHFPYHDFNYIVDLLREAAIDPTVKTIRITIYRLAQKSRVANALINAAKNGKKVVAVLELRARFDEKNNLRWSSVLEEHGVKVQFGVPGLKVHSKLILIERTAKGKSSMIAHIGSGNFHEGNSKIYTDFSLLTAHPKIADEVLKVFKFLKANYRREEYDYLMVAPYNLRDKMGKHIRHQMDLAVAGKKAEIRMKLNNLVDNELVQLLYEASSLGVKIRLIVRGICSLIPGVEDMSENIEVRSIIGRFLEHSRVFIFGPQEHLDQVYISSADLMTRNLDSRVEVAAPILDDQIKEELVDAFELYWRDNRKARSITVDLDNPYIENEEEEFSSQLEMRKFISDLNRKRRIL